MSLSFRFLVKIDDRAVDAIHLILYVIHLILILVLLLFIKALVSPHLIGLMQNDLASGVYTIKETRNLFDSS